MNAIIHHSKQLGPEQNKCFNARSEQIHMMLFSMSMFVFQILFYKASLNAPFKIPDMF